MLDEATDPFILSEPWKRLTQRLGDDPFSTNDPWSGSSYPIQKQSIASNAGDVWLSWKPRNLDSGGLELQRVIPRPWAWDDVPFVEVDEHSMVFERVRLYA